MVDPQSILAVGAAPLVFHEPIDDPLKLCEEGGRYCLARVCCVVRGRIGKFCLCVRVNPVAHAILARTLESASVPVTIAAFPFLTSSRRRMARSMQASWALDFGSKLAISNSSIFARSAAGRPSTSAARSLTGVDLTTPATGSKREDATDAEAACEITPLPRSSRSRHRHPWESGRRRMRCGHGRRHRRTAGRSARLLRWSQGAAR